MIIGFNAFMDDDSAVFNNTTCHTNYNKLDMTGGVLDQLYADENILIPYSTVKPDNWAYNTTINAKFGSLEGGSVEANNIQIEKIRFQKRQWNELEWHDVAELDYNSDEKMLYEVVDKNIANDFTYQYSIIPITSTILGNRVISDEVTASFEGVFISDKDSNYQLLYDVEISDIQNNISNSVFEPLNARYPIVVHSNLDYETFDITSTFISAETIENNGGYNNGIDIRMERLGKDKLMKFMKNGKPKVYRDQNGRLKLVSVVGKPTESPNNNINGIAQLSFSLVEIGDTDGETLSANNILEGLEVY